MTELITKVCDQEYAGTDDNIKLSFRNFHRAQFGREVCDTDYLGKYGVDDWERGMTQSWGGHYLMTCLGPKFRQVQRENPDCFKITKPHGVPFEV